MKLHNLAFATLLAGRGLEPRAPRVSTSRRIRRRRRPADSGIRTRATTRTTRVTTTRADDQGYDNQQPYYDPRPDGNYDDSGSYDDPGVPAGYYGNQGPVDQSVFYGELSPYGRWIQRGSYGWVWEPTQVAVGWRPYTQGHWVDTDYGWTWVSSEPWGWATYHYGRWTLDSEYGWLWVPGSEWGPAWVSFQEGGGYVGWAPLPPAVGFRAGIGLQIGGLSLSARDRPVRLLLRAGALVPGRPAGDRAAGPQRDVHPPDDGTSPTSRWSNNRVVNRSVDEAADRAGDRPAGASLPDRRNEESGAGAGRAGAGRPGLRSSVRPSTLAKPRPSVTPAHRRAAAPAAGAAGAAGAARAAGGPAGPAGSAGPAGASAAGRQPGQTGRSAAPAMAGRRSTRPTCRASTRTSSSSCRPARTPSATV